EVEGDEHHRDGDDRRDGAREALGALHRDGPHDFEQARDGQEHPGHRYSPCSAASGRIMGKRSTSRIERLFVSSMTSRSTPTPSPPAGGMPTLSASTKSASKVRKVDSSSSMPASCSRNFCSWMSGSLSSV